VRARDAHSAAQQQQQQHSRAGGRFLEATHVEQTKKSYDQMEIEGSAALELAKEPDCYTILASSIAPEIYGHLDVKKSLLLQVRLRSWL
jgi:DNA replicative helicase MCM subunit Mcm2 (Cdc46/Mcm family)